MPGDDMTTEKIILAEQEIQRAVVRISHEILEKNQGSETLVLVGIRTRGVFLAERIRKEIEAIEKKEMMFGVLDITLYRDDLGEIGPHAEVRETTMPDDISGKVVVLVDDVLYTGRTIRAALDAVMDFGRPKAIQLAVLIDRGHRELPIRADYVGKNVPTAKDEEVVLNLVEKDGRDLALIVPKEGDKNGG